MPYTVYISTISGKINDYNEDLPINSNDEFILLAYLFGKKIKIINDTIHVPCIRNKYKILWVSGRYKRNNETLEDFYQFKHLLGIFFYTKDKNIIKSISLQEEERLIKINEPEFKYNKHYVYFIPLTDKLSTKSKRIYFRKHILHDFNKFSKFIAHTNCWHFPIFTVNYKRLPVKKLVHIYYMHMI